MAPIGAVTEVDEFHGSAANHPTSKRQKTRSDNHSSSSKRQPESHGGVAKKEKDEDDKQNIKVHIVEHTKTGQWVN